MKILNVNMSIDPVTGGGTAERTVQISRALAAAGVGCRILTIQDTALDRPPVPVTALPALWPRFQVPFPAMASIAAAVRWADVVHLMNHWTPINALVYGAARRSKTPYVVCPAGALPLFGRSRLIKQVYNRVIGYRLVRDAEAGIAISPNEIPHFAAYGRPASRIVVIPNGVDPGAFAAADVAAFRRRFALGDHPFVLFMGRLNRIKGPDLLLEAFHRLAHRLSRHHLVFAGPDGGMLDALRKAAAAGPMPDRVHFTGFLGGAEKSSALKAASLVAIPSRQEAMSIVVLEAGVSGTAVLLTDRCGFDAVERAHGGRVVSATTDAISDGLAALLADEPLMAAMGAALRGFVLSHYSWDRIIGRYKDLYEGILARGRR